jgi:lysophospholipase L1-like esterase
MRTTFVRVPGSLRLVAAALLLTGCVDPVRPPGPPPPVDTVFTVGTVLFPNDTVYARGLMTPEANGRISRFLEKCRTRKTVTLAFLGGSISLGSALSDTAQRYSALLAGLVRREFGLSSVVEMNSSISATGSRYGASRVAFDLLRHDPDLVVIEFSVNDFNTAADDELRATLEGVVRQCLKHDPDLPVMLLFTMKADGANAQNVHADVGRHYALPMISYRDAVWPLITGGRVDAGDFFLDDPHPTPAGHKVAAGLLLAHLKRAAKLTGGGGVSVPAPLVTDLFEHAGILAPGDSAVRFDTSGWGSEVHAADRNGPPRRAFYTRGGPADTLTLRTRRRELTLGVRMQHFDTSSVRIEAPGFGTQVLNNAFPFVYTRTVHVFTAPDTGLRTVRVIHSGSASFALDWVLYAGEE